MEEIGGVYILYFDWNCLLHPQCFKVLAHNLDLTDQDKLEKKMFKRIIEYTNYVIRFVSPSNYVFFAIDGTAPLAKIRQQRQRRFGYAHDYRKEIMDEYGIPYNNSWSNVVITPGTEFMERLHSKIIKYYNDPKNRKNYCDPKSDLKILYSSYHTPGEGEHKILQDIKNRFTTDNKENIAIYGLDADLIFLAMASQRKHIYLVREETEFNRKKHTKDDEENVAEDLVYVDMDDTMDLINDTFRKTIIEYSNDGFDAEMVNESDLIGINFVDDYILACYLLGNDFLPHFPSIDLRRDGMELIIEKYVATVYDYNFTPIIIREDDGIRFNSEIFAAFIENLASEEYTFFVDKLRKYIEREKRMRCYESEPYKKRIWEIENMINEKIVDPVMLGIGEEEEWKFRYYKHFGSEEHQEEFKDQVCENYLEGIVWVAQYYMNDCQDWRWQYNFTHPPLISDLSQYINRKWKSKKFDLNEIAFVDDGPLPMFGQLLSVLPPKFNYLLPKNYRPLTTTAKSKIADMFPLEYEVDKLYKARLYQCVPLIPNVNVERILSAIEDIPLSKDEKKRCTVEYKLKEF
jgi:5'-3' exonuclease